MIKLDPHSKEFKELQQRNLNYIRNLRKRATRAEIIFRKFLIKNHIYHKFQKGLLKPFHRIVDFYIPYIGYIIEIDGSIHDRLVEKDNFKDYLFLRERGLKTIRITNTEILDGTFEQREDVQLLLLISPTQSRRESRKNKKTPQGEV